MDEYLYGASIMFYLIITLGPVFVIVIAGVLDWRERRKRCFELTMDKEEQLRIAEEKWETMSRRSKLKAWIHFIFFQTYEDQWFGFKMVYPPLIVLIILLAITMGIAWLVSGV